MVLHACLCGENFFNIADICLMPQLLALVAFYDPQYHWVIQIHFFPVVIEGLINREELLDMLVFALGSIGAEPIHIIHAGFDEFMKFEALVPHHAETFRIILADTLDVLVCAVGPVGAAAIVIEKLAGPNIMAEVAVVTFIADAAPKMLAHPNPRLIVGEWAVCVLAEIIVEERLANIVASASGSIVLRILLPIDYFLYMVERFCFKHLVC